MSNKTIKEIIEFAVDRGVNESIIIGDDEGTQLLDSEKERIVFDALSDITQILEEEKKKAVKEFADGILAKQKTYSYVKMSPGIFKFDTNKIIDAVPVSAITERLGK